jgi:hypothetical protein
MSAVASSIAKLILDPEELAYIWGWIEDGTANEDTRRQQDIHNARFELDQIRARLGRLTDALIDGVLEKPLFDARKATLLNDEQRILEKIRNLEAGTDSSLRRVAGFLELVKNAPVAYENAEPDEKRDLVKTLFSNLKLNDKNVDVTLKPSVQLIANRPKFSNGAPSRGLHRTWKKLLEELRVQFESDTTPIEMGA